MWLVCLCFCIVYVFAAFGRCCALSATVGKTTKTSWQQGSTAINISSKHSSILVSKSVGIYHFHNILNMPCGLRRLHQPETIEEAERRHEDWVKYVFVIPFMSNQPGCLSALTHFRLAAGLTNTGRVINNYVLVCTNATLSSYPHGSAKCHQ